MSSYERGSEGYLAHVRRQEAAAAAAYAEWSRRALSAEARELLEGSGAGAHGGVSIDEVPERLLADRGRVPGALGDINEGLVEEVSIESAAEALHAMLDWLVAGGADCAVKGFRGKVELIWDKEGWKMMPEADRQAAKLAKLLATRAAVLSWMLVPQLWGGATETDLAQRIGVTRSLVSFYVIQFSEKFRIHSRGMKSVLARGRFSDAQRGRWARERQEKQQQQLEIQYENENAD